MNGRWVKKPRWKVSHLLRDDDHRPRNLRTGTAVGQAACGSFITIDEHLENEPTGIDTTDRCGRCEIRLSRDGDRP